MKIVNPATCTQYVRCQLLGAVIKTDRSRVGGATAITVMVLVWACRYRTKGAGFFGVVDVSSCRLSSLSPGTRRWPRLHKQKISRIDSFKRIYLDNRENDVLCEWRESDVTFLPQV